MRIALVTGANSGFGMLMTVELIKAGYIVIATMRDLEKGTSLQQEIAKLDQSANLHIRKLEVANEEDIMQVYQYVQEQFDRLDVLINNAGYSQGGFLADISMENWKLQQETNVFGTVHMTQAFLPLLERSQRGQIINLSSVSGIMGLPGLSAYCASKFAIEGFSESIRLELRSKDIYVSLIEPASYQTDIWKKAFEKLDPINHSDILKDNVFQYVENSASSAGDPKEVAALVIRICESKYPKLRYPIGKGALFLSFAKKLVPWRIIEWMVLKKLR